MELNWIYFGIGYTLLMVFLCFSYILFFSWGWTLGLCFIGSLALGWTLFPCVLSVLCFSFFFNGLIRYVFIVIYGVWNHRSMSDLVNFSWKEEWGCYEQSKNGEPARTMYLLTEGEVAKILICGILGDWDFTQWLQLPKSNWMIPDEIPQLPRFSMVSLSVVKFG